MCSVASNCSIVLSRYGVLPVTAVVQQCQDMQCYQQLQYSGVKIRDGITYERVNNVCVKNPILGKIFFKFYAVMLRK